MTGLIEMLANGKIKEIFEIKGVRMGYAVKNPIKKPVEYHKKSGHGYTKNTMQKSSKKRRKMAKASRKSNRR